MRVCANKPSYLCLCLVTLAINWETRFEDMENRLQKRIEKLELELSRHKEGVMSLVDLCEHDSKRHFDNEAAISRKMDTISSDLDDFTANIENKFRFDEDQTDKIEGMTKRKNIKLFGVREDNRESYWNCLQIVLQIFREALPTIQWTEKDIMRVQRLGARRGNQDMPRPILVEMTTFLDKLTLLRFGRGPLQNMGIGIASELTSRQMKTLSDLRAEGHEAYYRNGKLWFRDDRDDRNNKRGITRPQPTRRKRRQKQETTSRHLRDLERAVHSSQTYADRATQHMVRDDYQTTGTEGTWAPPRASLPSDSVHAPQ